MRTLVWRLLIAVLFLGMLHAVLGQSTSTTQAPTTTETDTDLPSSGLFAIDDVYIVLIGMGGVILLLLVVIIVTLCQYGSANK